VKVIMARFSIFHAPMVVFALLRHKRATGRKAMAHRVCAMLFPRALFMTAQNGLAP
jgi:hypothetical protein